MLAAQPFIGFPMPRCLTVNMFKALVLSSPCWHATCTRLVTPLTSRCPTGRRPSRGGQASQGSVAPWLQRLNVHVVQQVATKHTQFRLEGKHRLIRPAAPMPHCAIEARAVVPYCSCACAGRPNEGRHAVCPRQLLIGGRFFQVLPTAFMHPVILKDDPHAETSRTYTLSLEHGWRRRRAADTAGADARRLLSLGGGQAAACVLALRGPVPGAARWQDVVSAGELVLPQLQLPVCSEHSQKDTCPLASLM